MINVAQTDILIEILDKGKEFAEQLLRENRQLRLSMAELQASKSKPGLVEGLRKQVSDLERRYEQSEADGKACLDRYKEVEQQNSNLVNLYVASHQLHSTLDFREVLQIVQEIISNMIGAESFALLLLDETTGDLQTVLSDGELPGLKNVSAKVGHGVVGWVAETGDSYFADDVSSGGTLEAPLAVVPMKIQNNVTGIITVYRLLQQKHEFTAVDFELFSVLAGHAATAIFAAKLYSESERKLTTIQSFLNMLTT